jgi:multidrug efflux pump subunit AcrA (membrane-fusion protein)
MFAKYGFPLLGLLALAFSIFSVRHMTPAHVAAAPPQDPPASEFQKQVGGVGMVEPASENISIGVPVSGLVTEVRVKPGDVVQKGQALLRLDDRELRAELALRQSNVDLAAARLERLRNAPRAEDLPPAEARVEQAKAQLADAESQLRMIEAVTDRRAIRAEDLEKRRWAASTARAALLEAEANLAQLKAGAWKQDILVAQAELHQARQQVERIKADLDRLTVTSPVKGVILQVKTRPGEFAAAGPLEQPLLLMGSAGPLHVRVDVDEKDAWRVSPAARAYASVRGNAKLRFPLELVRMEPYVVPKRNLTGETTERTDTRVLQVIYKLPEGAAVKAGQQMDVYIESEK